MEINLKKLEETLKKLKVKVVKETDRALVIVAGNGVHLTRLPSKNGVRKRVIRIFLEPKQSKNEEIIDPEEFGCEVKSDKGLKILIQPLSGK